MWFGTSFRIGAVAFLGILFLAATDVQSQNRNSTSNEDLADAFVRPGDIESLTMDANLNGNADSNSAIAAEVEDVVDIRTFATPSLLTTPARLLGDWNGLLPRFEDNGITPTITWVSNMAGNPTGGLRQGFTECDNLGIDLMTDLGKMCDMEDSKFHVSMSQRSGASLSNKYIGNAFNVQQVYGGETFKLIDVEYIKRYYDGKLTFHMGRIAAGDDFLTSPYYWVFMQNGIDGNPVGIFKNSPGMSAYPNSAWGARMRMRPTDRTYLLTGVYNGDPTVRDNTDHGLDWSMHGPAFVITEAAYQRNGLPGDKGPLGNYKIGAWYNAGTFTNSAGRVLESSSSVVGLPPTATQQGNWGYYALADQVIWRKTNEHERNIGVFTSILVSPEEDYNAMPFFCNGGVAWTGPFDRRPTDILGFAVVYGKFSDDLRQAEQLAQTFDPTVTVQDYELAFEWCYRFRMRDGALYVQPDFQYIVQPNGSNEIPNAFVVGCQLGLNF